LCRVVVDDDVVVADAAVVEIAGVPGWKPVEEWKLICFSYPCI
jgi:hypothetical protein